MEFSFFLRKIKKNPANYFIHFTENPRLSNYQISILRKLLFNNCLKISIEQYKLMANTTLTCHELKNTLQTSFNKYTLCIY